jgi:polyhydroxyalkanoate synthesis regulator phasin
MLVLLPSLEESIMSPQLADRIRNEIAVVRGEIDAQKALAKRHVQNVAVESEIAQRMRALHTRLEELERNLQHCASSSNSQ